MLHYVGFFAPQPPTWVCLWMPVQHLKTWIPSHQYPATPWWDWVQCKLGALTLLWKEIFVICRSRTNVHTNALLETHSKKCLHFSKFTSLVIVFAPGQVQSISISGFCPLASVKIHVCKLHKFSVSTRCHDSFLMTVQYSTSCTCGFVAGVVFT